MLIRNGAVKRDQAYIIFGIDPAVRASTLRTCGDGCLKISLTVTHIIPLEEVASGFGYSVLDSFVLSVHPL